MPGSDRSADRGVRAVRERQGQPDADHAPTMSPSTNARPMRAPLTPTAASPQATAIAVNSRTPWRTPQPIEPSSHSPRNSDVPTTARMRAQTTTAKAIADEGGDLLDLAADGRGLGLGEVDVRHDEPYPGVARRADRARAGRRGWGWGRAVVQGGAPARGSGGRERDRVRPDDSSARMAATDPDASGTSRDRYAAGMSTDAIHAPAPDRRAPEHRLGADGRRDRDTNAGELARALTLEGVTVRASRRCPIASMSSPRRSRPRSSAPTSSSAPADSVRPPTT